MKKRNFTNWKVFTLASFVLVFFTLSSCGDDDEGGTPNNDLPVTAVFSFTAAGNTITFVNASVNASTYSWDFGDGSAESTEENPSHTYGAAGTYSVSLTASNPSFTNTVTIDVTTENAGPIALVLLNKVWTPIRGEALAVAMGPQSDFDYTDPAGLWFTWGDREGAATQLLNRPSLMNDEYTFNSDGTYNVDFKGDFWGEFGIWADQPEFNETDIDISGGTLPLNGKWKFSEWIYNWYMGFHHR